MMTWWLVTLRLVGPFAVNVAAVVALKLWTDPYESGVMLAVAGGARVVAIMLLPMSGLVWPLLAATYIAASHARGRASAAWTVGLFAATVLANTAIWLLGRWLLAGPTP
jgi:hypothetical protein